MSNVSATIRNHHRELTERLTAQVTAIEDSRPEADPEALVAFLKSELLPHAHGEDQYLYPALDPVIKEHGAPTATMQVDHEFIGGYVRQLDETAQALRTATEGERPALQQRLRRLAIQLDGLFQVHLAKEERVYLPLFEEYVSHHDQQRILDGMHEAPHDEGTKAAGADEVTSLDVRDIPPPRRHPMIFTMFEHLQPGAAFVLINDHDPKPLYYQLNFEHAGQLVWEYLEEGPQTWRVRIGKTA